MPPEVAGPDAGSGKDGIMKSQNSSRCWAREEALPFPRAPMQKQNLAIYTEQLTHLNIKLRVSTST